MSTISIQCIHCKKRYNAPATMAGKKVKCKHCAKVFEIPPNEEMDLAENDAPQTGIPAPFKAIHKSAPAAAPPDDDESESPKAPAGGKLGNASAGFTKKIARNEDAEEIEFAQSASPIVMLRPSIPHDFPGAAVLDQWGPLVMIAAGLGCLSLAAIGTNQSESWVGTARLGAYLFFCLLIAFPLGYLAIRAAANKCRLMLPPMPAVRALGAFSLSFALALILWLTAGSMGMLIVGTIMGLGLVCLSVWFLFRIQSQEMSTVLGSAGAAFVASIVISYLALAGINMIFASSARSKGTQLAVSPMGPTFEWDVPVSDGVKPKPPKNSVVAVLPDVPGTNPSATQSTSIVPTPPAPSTSTTTPPPNTTVANVPPVDPVIKTTVPTPPVTPTTPEIVKPVPNTTIETPTHELSPLISKITPVADLGDFGHVIFPSGSGSNAVAIKKGETEDTVAFLSGSPMAVKAETKFDVEKELSSKFLLSPSGETLARLISFPKLSVLLWDVSKNKESKVVPLNAAHGKPELLGFGLNDSIVILWTIDNFIDIEVINAKANPPQSFVLLRLKMFEKTSVNPTMSPDGRQMAVGTFIAQKGGLDLWDLTMTRRDELRTCLVPLGTWITPTAVAYSPNSQFLSAYFEQGNKAVIYSYRTATAQLLHEFPYRTLAYPPGLAESFTGHSLDYIDSNLWLLLGRVLIDVDSGKVLGDLQIDNVKAQRVLDKETFLVHTQSSSGKNQLQAVHLKPDAIAAKRQELGIKPAKAP